MPYRQRALVYYKKMIDLLTYSLSVNLKPVWIASGLLLLGVLLTWTAVVGIRHSEIAIHMPQKPVQVGTQEVQTDMPVLQNVDPVPENKQAENVVAVKAQRPIWPIQGQITRGVGWYENPVLKEWRYHAGYDISGNAGAGVKAAMDGEVTEIVNGTNSGLAVVIKHGDYVISYGSLGSVLVKKGESITAGSEIGTIGTFPTEPFPHLHLIIKRGDKLVAPQELFH